MQLFHTKLKMANAVSRQVVPDISKDCSDFICNTKLSQKALRCCESSERAHPAHRHTAQDFNHKQHRCENLRSCRGHLFILRNIMDPLQPVVTICTAQWSLYVPPSGHYMYRTVVTICTTQWSLYVPYSGHYMFRKVITIRTARWSLYVPPGGHYMYRTVVTICTAQWSLYVSPV